MKQTRLCDLCVTWFRTMGLGAVCLAAAAGCSEPVAEPQPQDIEQARQEHINMSQRERAGSSSQP